MTGDQTKKWLIYAAIAVGGVMMWQWVKVRSLQRLGWPRWAAELFVELDF